jgi:hypothetical protein
LKGLTCDFLMNYVIEFIRNTSSIKSIFLAGRWELWLSDIITYFEHTLRVFTSMNVRVYVIQQGPLHSIPSNSVYTVYKIMFGAGKLTNQNLRSVSCTREQYAKQQAGVERFFAKFNATRGFTVIYIDDLICEPDVCLMGTGERPFFTDPVHLTPFASARLKPRLQKYLSY